MFYLFSQIVDKLIFVHIVFKCYRENVRSYIIYGQCWSVHTINVKITIKKYENNHFWKSYDLVKKKVILDDLYKE